MSIAATRPRIFAVGEDRRPVRGWPIGPALLAAVGDINRDVQEALAQERARLGEQGYPADLPQPALWWVPSPGVEAQAAEQLLAVADD
jgi:hypothetical protein